MYAQTSYSQVPFASSDRVDISFAVTGVSATGELGVVKTGISVQPTSFLVEALLGTAIGAAGAKAAVTGVETSSAVGDVTVYLQKLVTPIGVSANAETGTISISGDASVELTSVNNVVYMTLNDVQPYASANVLVNGFALTMGLGEVEVDSKATVFATGVNATGLLNSVSLITNNAITVTGFGLTSYLGIEEVDGSATVYPTGVNAIMSLGTVEIDSQATVYLTGVSANCRLPSQRIVNVWGLINTAQTPNWNQIPT